MEAVRLVESLAIPLTDNRVACCPSTSVVWDTETHVEAQADRLEPVGCTAARSAQRAARHPPTRRRVEDSKVRRLDHSKVRPLEGSTTRPLESTHSVSHRAIRSSPPLLLSPPPLLSFSPPLPAYHIIKTDTSSRTCSIPPPAKWSPVQPAAGPPCERLECPERPWAPSPRAHPH